MKPPGLFRSTLLGGCARICQSMIRTPTSSHSATWAIRLAAAAALIACAGAGAPALGDAGATDQRSGIRRVVVEGPAGPIDLSAQPRASEMRAEATPRFMRRRAVVVVDGPITDAQRAELTALGVGRVQLMGDDAYTAAIPPGATAAVEALGFVRSVAWFRPEWKLDPGLDRRDFVDAARIDLRDRGMARVHIHLFAEADAPEVIAVRDAIAALPGAVVHGTTVIGENTLVSADVARVDFGAVAGLPSVQFVEPAPEITFRNNTVRGIVQSNVPGTVPVHNAGITGAGEIIAVCDSGLDTAHCAFADVPGKIIAYNGAPNVTPHGTHVACIAAGDAVVAGDLRGHAFDAGLVFSRTPTFTFDQLADTLETQSSQGAFVHTNSWGDDTSTLYTGMCRSIDDFMHYHEDQLVVFAATNLPTLKTPENAKNALSVAAVMDTPNQNVYCSGGGGLTADGRLKPDVAAPGCGVTSASASTACGTASNTGTSMAAPAVAGAALLVRQYYDEGFYPSGAATPADAFVPSGALLKATMINSATGTTGVPNLPAAASTFRAWGRVMVDDALFFAGDTRRSVIRDLRNEDGLVTGTTVDVPVVVTGAAQNLKVTVVWTDPPPAPGVQTALVNNLDLTLIAPDATPYLGNVFTGGVSVTGGAADTKNNVEQVHISAPALGAWTVRISGTSIPSGPQGFALVVSGEIDAAVRPLSIAVMGAPDVIASSAPVPPFTVHVDEGSDVLVGGSPMLHYRYAGPSFTAVPLTPLGGNDFEAQLPQASCGHMPEFYVSAAGNVTGTVTSPVGGMMGARSVLVGTDSASVVASEDFESGIPGTWTVSGTPTEWSLGVPGPWVSTSSCSIGGGCTGSVWAYCGNAAACSYGTGGTVTGGLKSPVINLPAIGPGETLTLVYCSAMTNENVSRYDRGFVRINGVELDEAPHTAGAWTEREVDLSGFAGQPVQIEFFFNTVDSFSNAYTGWLVDSMAIERSSFQCVDTCPADLNGSGAIEAGDFTILAGGFGTEPNGTRSDGDITGDGRVNVQDFVVLAGAYGQICN